MFEESKTGRGFGLLNFQDHYGHKCSLQASSLATEECIWLGIDDPDPSIMHVDAKKLGLPCNVDCGWVPYHIPDEVSINTRMHLNREQARKLATALLEFSVSGEIKP